MQNQTKNWTCYEQQPLASVTTTSSTATQFSTAGGKGATDARLINRGTVDVFVAFGDSTVVAYASASAAGKKQYLVRAEEDLIVEKGLGQYFAAITDTGTSILMVEAGQGN